MPQTLALAMFELGIPGATALAQFGATALGGALFNIGISVGLSYLAQSLLGSRVPTPKPEDVQQSTRQPTQPRVRHYGRVKTSGPWIFAETKAGSFYKVLALGVGQFDAIEQVWVDDKQVTLRADGAVLTDPFSTSRISFGSYCRIETRLGVATESYYSDLSSVFSEWTSAHRGDGIASLFATQLAADQDRYLDCYSNGINTNYRVVARTSKLRPIGGGANAYSDYAGNIVYDYLLSADGLRLPTTVTDTTAALQGWTAASSRSAEAVPLKAGGTENRYRIWGSYRLDERPADVLKRLLMSCDGRLVPTNDGGLTLDIGDWYEPTVTLDATTIVAFSDLQRGRDVLDTANTIRATYTEPAQDYQSTDADPWVDAADVTARGEIAQDIELIMVPSHSQARRLMKLAAYRANPNWRGTFQCNLKALAAFGERFIRITYPLFGIDEVFEVQDFKFNVGEDQILQGVTITVQSMPQEAYTWDASQEEGNAPVSDSTSDDHAIPVPTDDGRAFDVTIVRKNISGTLVPYAELAWDDPPSVALEVEAQGKRTADTNWTSIQVGQDASTAESNALADGEEYEFQIRYVTLGARTGNWTSGVVISAVGDPTPPDPLTGVSATGGTGAVDISWTAPNSANYAAANIYRNTVNDEASATLVHTEYGPQSNMDSWRDTGLASGTYYYWLTARNASGVESTSVATGAVTAS